MSKYIDVDRLKAVIERRIEETKSMKPSFDQFWAGQISAFKGAIKIAESLQQEQMEVDLEKERKNLSHTMLTYAAEVFGGKTLLEDISYSYRQELADYFRDLAKTAKEE